uniref:Pentatricopeptide repeat-containing protein n=1 Tax=Phaseolus vulgaris TaxID=3885 RepID=V7CQ15_PHAVU|nr:hypothetical protein PHAVU_002G309900g [Phaseolus vulgaris]ESW32292.1 hypothetical protein PHAVU_002G309900g [Phaseolus vulgaris]
MSMRRLFQLAFPLRHRCFSTQNSVLRSLLDYSGSDLVALVAAHLCNCATVRELNRVYAHVLRTHFFISNPAPFNWNNIIRSYTRLEAPRNALRIHVLMLRNGVLPDCYTLPIVLKAVSQTYDVKLGKQVHSVGIKVGLQCNEFCETGFLSLYFKAGEFGSARMVFDENPDPKLGSWNAVIGGLSQSGLVRDAISVFLDMRRRGFAPDGLTMVNVTSACGKIGDLNLALQLHKCVFQVEAGERTDVLMLNSLIDMYGKCGRLDLAYKVFATMEERSVSSWTSMIVVACVHGGAVREGRIYFDMMKNVYGIAPQLQHYGCMVDLLGRAGLLEDARRMVEEMPMKPNSVVWGCLMGACEKYGNVDMAEWVAKHLQELEPWSDGVYVVLSNIYANRGLWKEVERIRSVMEEGRLAKIPAYSLTTNSD